MSQERWFDHENLSRLLSTLVAIPSVKPMGRALVGALLFETRLSNYLEAWFRDLGVGCARQPIAAGRDNVLARYDAPSVLEPPRPEGQGAGSRLRLDVGQGHQVGHARAGRWSAGPNGANPTAGRSRPRGAVAR